MKPVRIARKGIFLENHFIGIRLRLTGLAAEHAPEQLVAVAGVSLSLPALLYL
jgi:hypothetical protein